MRVCTTRAPPESKRPRLLASGTNRCNGRLAEQGARAGGDSAEQGAIWSRRGPGREDSVYSVLLPAWSPCVLAAGPQTQAQPSFTCCASTGIHRTAELKSQTAAKMRRS
eukprot:COSAG01_NODE_317_length_18969_cov_378.101219_13_plen_109_part_00